MATEKNCGGPSHHGFTFNHPPPLPSSSSLIFLLVVKRDCGELYGSECKSKHTLRAEQDEATREANCDEPLNSSTTELATAARSS